MPKLRARKSVAKGAPKSAVRPPRARRPARKLHAKATPKTRAKARAETRAVEAVLAEVAHEIRTPLTGILAMSELLAASELKPRERNWATAIKSTAEHLATLTSLIVDAARAEAKGLILRREPIDPRRLGADIAATLTARAGAKGLRGEVLIADELPAVLIGDPVRLRASLENLIDNAVKFTERGGVRVEITSQPAARARVRLIFAVTDSGIGLARADVKRLFRPFTQASAQVARRYGGAGLGLAFVKRIAKAMGGDLTVASVPGAGSRFRLSVELDPALPESGMGEQTAGAAPARRLHILCAEDNPYGRVVLNTLLTELGHVPDFVGTGEAAVAAVARGHYDAVLMDVMLSGIDGFEATRRIRALGSRTAGVPIIGISGRADPADEANGRAAGMDGYLAKPLAPRALTQMLDAVTPPAS